MKLLSADKVKTLKKKACIKFDRTKDRQVHSEGKAVIADVKKESNLLYKRAAFP